MCATILILFPPFQKGTLLNRLFGTDFDIMSETARRQTTKGEYKMNKHSSRVLRSERVFFFSIKAFG